MAQVLKSASLSQKDNAKMMIASAIEVLSQAKYHKKGAAYEERIRLAKKITKELLRTDKVKSSSALIRNYLLREAGNVISGEAIIDEKGKSYSKGPQPSYPETQGKFPYNNPTLDKQSLPEKSDECITRIKSEYPGISDTNASKICDIVTQGVTDSNNSVQDSGEGFVGIKKVKQASIPSWISATDTNVSHLHGNSISPKNVKSAGLNFQHNKELYSTSIASILQRNKEERVARREARNKAIKSASNSEIPPWAQLVGGL
jgi:hypothetical protein